MDDSNRSFTCVSARTLCKKCLDTR